MKQQNRHFTTGGFVRSLFKNKLRMGAILAVILVVAVLYKYSSVNAESIYDRYYTSYDLGTMRGNGTMDTLQEAYKLEEAFKNKNWSKVATLYNEESARSAKYYFLAGMADLELHQYQVAVEQFEAVLSENAKNHNTYFKDEAEYFLAFGYLMNNESGKAIRLLANIRQNKEHQYYPMANQISGIDMKILGLKSK